MNRFYVVMILQLLNLTVVAQRDSSGSAIVFVSCNKTSSIVFPQVIKSIDRGSRDLFVQKVNGAENVLQLKASKENFDETNLTIITADDKLYAFTVCYAANPPAFIVKLDSSGSSYENVAQRKRSVHGIKDETFGMRFYVKGIYIENQILYFQFELDNQSNISYAIDMLRFYTADKHQARRTAIQQLDQVPLNIYHRPVNIAAQSKQVFVAAFSQFTIPGAQLFYGQVSEQNGGRNLKLKISNKRIVRARVL